MNKNQIKGKAKDMAGTVQGKVGRLVGSKKQQTRGLAKQVAGKAQKAVGDIQEESRKPT